ncbi:MAG: hypothetical protein IPI35_07820 [Deltaproteobacteria bacterium]|nr:hypothetical protein [Deltaproteobacteria bacterium]
MLGLLIFACAQTTPSSDLLTATPASPVSASYVAAAAGPAVANPAGPPGLSPEFAEAVAVATDADPFGKASAAAEAAAEAAAPAPAEGAAVAEVAPAEAVVEPAAPPPEAPPAMGLPTQPAWAVRLLMTLPQAQPPRAALGLPSGEERIVSPGSMLPDLGLIVIAVGADSVQLARVTPAGDHAVVEPLTLTAQYPIQPKAP